jgi:predicted CXXCH cytochrome family protein
MRWIWRNHVFRPLMVVIALVAILLIVRIFVVPGDFGVHGDQYTYNWYRQGNISDWEAVTVKYQGEQYCTTCHQDKVDLISTTPHSIIQCENCHGPALNHPKDPPKLTVDTSRDLCLRCHSELGYSASGRAIIKGIDPDTHNPGVPCVNCHNPHDPTGGILSAGGTQPAGGTQ